MLECARSVGATYKCLNCKGIGGDLLNANAENYKLCNLAKKTKATIKDCTGHLSKAGKKDALFIADIFNDLSLDFYAEKNHVDIFY